MQGRATNVSGQTRAVVGNVSSPNGFAAHFTGAPGSRNYFERAVGIGTDNPQALLDVAGTIQVDGAARFASLSGQGLGVVMTDSFGQLYHAGSARPLAEKAVDFQITLICDDPNNPGAARTGAASFSVAPSGAPSLVRAVPANLISSVSADCSIGCFYVFPTWPVDDCIVSASATSHVAGSSRSLAVAVGFIESFYVRVYTFGQP